MSASNHKEHAAEIAAGVARLEAAAHIEVQIDSVVPSNNPSLGEGNKTEPARPAAIPAEPEGRATPTVSLLCGDVIDVLRDLPAGRISTVITSPPYYGLRSYGIPPRKWADGSECVLGDEDTVERYLDHLVEVFREVKRVLHPRGTCWLNLGDSYAGGGKHAERPEIYNIPGDAKPTRPRQKYAGYKIESAVDRAWLAALIDGEGCIQIHEQENRNPEWAPTFQVDVSVGMMTEGMVRRAHEITALGVVGLQARGVWDWSVRGQQAAALLREVYPYLILKQKQAALACELAVDMDTRQGHRVRPISQEVVSYRRSIKQAVSDLNQRNEIVREVIPPPPLVGARSKLTGKDLLMVPARAALALQADGWILRNDLIWAKAVSFLPSFSGSVMPESTRDRATWAHEHVFHLALREDYFYDQDGCREPFADSTTRQLEAPYKGRGRKDYAAAGAQNPSDVKRRVLEGLEDRGGRNLRNVWIVPKQNFKGAHFATFPEKLVEPIVKLASSERGVCEVCAAPVQRRTIKSEVPPAVRESFEASRSTTAADTGRTDGHTARRPNHRRKVLREEWEPSCGCGAGIVPATVCDIFNGSGRTGMVSRRLGRSYIGIDVNPEYIEMARGYIMGTTTPQEEA